MYAVAERREQVAKWRCQRPPQQAKLLEEVGGRLAYVPDDPDSLQQSE